MDLRSSLGSDGAHSTSTPSRRRRQRPGKQSGSRLARRIFATMQRQSIRRRLLRRWWRRRRRPSPSESIAAAFATTSTAASIALFPAHGQFLRRFSVDSSSVGQKLGSKPGRGVHFQILLGRCPSSCHVVPHRPQKSPFSRQNYLRWQNSARLVQSMWRG